MKDLLKSGATEKQRLYTIRSLEKSLKETDGVSKTSCELVIKSLKNNSSIDFGENNE